MQRFLVESRTPIMLCIKVRQSVDLLGIGCFMEDKNYSASPRGKSGPKELLPDSPPCINQLQRSLRELPLF